MGSKTGPPEPIPKWTPFPAYLAAKMRAQTTENGVRLAYFCPRYIGRRSPRPRDHNLQIGLRVRRQHRKRQRSVKTNMGSTLGLNAPNKSEGGRGLPRHPTRVALRSNTPPRAAAPRINDSIHTLFWTPSALRPWRRHVKHAWLWRLQTV